MEEGKGYYVSDLVHLLAQNYDKEYAYTTIATVLKRLQKKGVLELIKTSGKTRDRNMFIISEQGQKEDMNDFLKQYFYRFGAKGIKHLGELMDNDFDEEEFNHIKKELDL